MYAHKMFISNSFSIEKTSIQDSGQHLPHNKRFLTQNEYSSMNFSLLQTSNSYSFCLYHKLPTGNHIFADNQYIEKALSR